MIYSICSKVPFMKKETAQTNITNRFNCGQKGEHTPLSFPLHPTKWQSTILGGSNKDSLTKNLHSVRHFHPFSATFLVKMRTLCASTLTQVQQFPEMFRVVALSDTLECRDPSGCEPRSRTDAPDLVFRRSNALRVSISHSTFEGRLWVVEADAQLVREQRTSRKWQRLSG
jgi:hypothetical protein